MDKINIQDLDGKDLPFFARFLEGQIEDISEGEAGDVVGGKHCRRCSPPIAMTRKYPSDNEDMAMTKKYPSDSEDSSGGGPIVTQKFPSDGEDNPGGTPIATTLKYPSDNEDGAGGGIATTMKYPSDNEESHTGIG
jgi:Serine endopeptidase inhibitors